jgi:hypothetical protein
MTRAARALLLKASSSHTSAFLLDHRDSGPNIFDRDGLRDRLLGPEGSG